MDRSSLYHSIAANQAYYDMVFEAMRPMHERICLERKQILNNAYCELSEMETRLRAMEAEFGYKYNPDEPRIPAGQPGGGQWTTGGPASSNNNDDNNPIQLAANDGMPGDQQRANKQVGDIANQLGMDKDQRRELHDAITGQNYGYHQVLNIAKGIVNK